LTSHGDDAAGHPAPAGRRRLLLAGLGTAALAAGLALGLLLRPAGTGGEAGVLPASPLDLGGPFELTNHSGGRTALADLRGRVVMLFFGYTNCPDVCPTALATLRAVKQALGLQAPDLEVVFVGVDPARDTPEKLAAYVGHFDADFIGLTGTIAEITGVAASYGVAVERGEPDADGRYDVGHTAFGYLIDRAGRVRNLYPSGTPADTLLAGVRALLTEDG
jgi:protein SCO1/2